MPSSTLTFFQCFAEDLSEKVHNSDTDVFKAMLSLTTPNVATMTVKTDATDISAGFGYTAGGHDIQTSTSRSGGTLTVAAVDVTITASGGTIGPFRYIYIYNDTAASDQLVGYLDYGSSQSILDTKQLTIDFGTALWQVTV